MPIFDSRRRQLVGYLLVLLQFGLLTALGGLALPRLLLGEMATACWLLLALAGALGGWTLLHNRLGNFNIHPEPKAGGSLVTSGPYQFIRHPMYSTVLLGAAAMACTAGGALAWLAWAALFGVLLVKASLEERWLCEHHAGYASYCSQCKRFIPWVF